MGATRSTRPVGCILKNAVLAFLREYQAEHQRTQAFARRMATLKLLEPVQANVAMTSGQKLALTDFKVVSRTRLKMVPGYEWLEVREPEYLVGRSIEVYHIAAPDTAGAESTGSP